MDVEIILKVYIRYYCHYTGKYKGSAHSIQNLK